MATGCQVLGAALLLTFGQAEPALAQSAETPIVSTATSRSLDSAVEDLTKDTINEHIMGANRGAGTPGLSAFPTGRLRYSSHDGLNVTGGAASYGANRTTGFHTEERSAFLNGTYLLPGEVLGGRLKLSGFIGVNALRMDLEGTLFGQTGTAHNNSLIYGSSALLAFGSSYLMLSGFGFLGDTSIDQKTIGLPSNNYKIGTWGGIGSVVAGHVFDIAPADGLKLDVRSNLSYSHHEGDTIASLETPEYSTWSQTTSLMLFSINQLADGAVIRPYIQGNLKFLFGYDNIVKFTPGNPAFNATWAFDQAKTYGGGEIGVNYIKGAYTFGAAAYLEDSKDERTYGGRLGVSIKFD